MTVAAVSPGRSDVDHELLWSLVGIVTIGGGWLAATLGVPVLPAGCVFKAVVGLPCLTCGGTRAALALAGGHLGAAFRWNPLVAAVLLGWAAYPVYGLGAVVGLWPRLRLVASARECVALRIAAVTLLAGTWIFLAIDGR